jgi:hypothetical protein
MGKLVENVSLGAVNLSQPRTYFPVLICCLCSFIVHLVSMPSLQERKMYWATLVYDKLLRKCQLTSSCNSLWMHIRTLGDVFATAFVIDGASK